MAAQHPSRFTFILVSLWCTLARAQAPPLYPALFILGDSLVDVGNNNYISSIAKANTVPNGIDFPNHQATGRFCNGKTVFDILAQYINLPFPPPFLAPSSTGRAILQGLNYASGAGGILNGTGFNYFARLSFDIQLDYFEKTVSELKSMLGPQATKDHVANSLFAILLGNNDYINNYFLLASKTRPIYTPQAYEDLLIETYRGQLERLYNLGARKIVISNVGPLGCIPSRLAAAGSQNGECIQADNEKVVGFNAALKGVLEELTSTLPGSIWLYGNAYDSFYGLIRDGASYGFTVKDQGCCGGGTYKGQLPCIQGLSLCPDRSKYIFWDPYHPTEAVNVILGRLLFEGPPSAVSPMNVLQLSSVHL